MSKFDPDTMYRYCPNNMDYDSAVDFDQKITNEKVTYAAVVNSTWFTNSCGGCCFTPGYIQKHLKQNKKLRSANTRGAMFVIGDWMPDKVHDDEIVKVVQTKNGPLTVHVFIKAK